MKILDKSWKYISEGNVHIVVQLLETDCVLRLIKDDIIPVNLDVVLYSVDFVNLITVPLLGNQYYTKEDVIQIPEDNLTQLVEDLHPLRPRHRIKKSTLSQYAVRAPNLSIVSLACHTNYCIEIKPKEGFVSTNFRKYMKCYYCFKQHLKLHTNQIEKISGYCPLDLFSGCKKRMKLALLNLIDNPQNNLKLFKNGTLIYSDNNSTKADFENVVEHMNCFSSLDLFLDFLIEILLSSKDNQSIELKESNLIVDTTIKNKSCDEYNMLNKTSFLYNLLNLQKISDNISYNSEVEPDYFKQILHQLKVHRFNLKLEKDKKSFFNVIPPEHIALISAIAKDCSIMISFTPEHSINHPTINVEGKKISYKLSVTDLEPKSFKTLSKREETEKQLIDIFENSIES